MGIISTDKNKITLIYNSGISLGKQTYSYVCTSDKDILAIDTSKTNITGTQWLEIADGLDLDISDLIQREFPNYRKLYDPKVKLKPGDWIKVIQNHPEVVWFPILIMGNNFYLIKTPSDFINLTDADSADISRNLS
ncbi:hypothetical protein [uncultured Aquimarina sp.]|uniref:arsenate reductase family protein n=1 Tax=uncultured Aquimarina sp. TaxID=575652 RepID=UPI002621AB95|nr:hypothetical protein [uncultured Aquimarina sp.]